MKQKDLKNLINIACNNPDKYHLIKPIVDKIREGGKFHYWQLVLTLSIEEQKHIFSSIRDGSIGIIDHYAYIVHDKDQHEDGSMIRAHVHMFVHTAKQYSYLNFLKQTNLDCITAIPTEEINKQGWLDYVTNHTSGKHVYDIHDVQFSDDAFKSTFFKEGKGMKGMLTKDKIDLICSVIEPYLKERDKVYVKQSEINKLLASDITTADVFNYQTLYHNFVEIPLQEHNKSVSELQPLYDFDNLFDSLRSRRLPKEVEKALYDYFTTGEIADPSAYFDKTPQVKTMKHTCVTIPWDITPEIPYKKDETPDPDEEFVVF